MQRASRLTRELSLLATEPPPGITCWQNGQLDDLRARTYPGASQRQPWPALCCQVCACCVLWVLQAVWKCGILLSFKNSLACALPGLSLVLIAGEWKWSHIRYFLFLDSPL